MLWLDKYRPHSLSEMKFHSTLNQQLLQLASPEKVQSLPHLLFYGPSGAGKKARVSALLRAVYGPGADKVKVDMRNFKISGGKVVDQGAAADGVELAILSSSFHVEMSPSDVGPFKDRLITQAVVKEMAQSNMPTGAVTFKIVVLNDVDELSRDAQAALRRTMEKYSSTCRFILVSQNPCRVIDPLRSRCIALRVPSPSVEEIQVVLHGVASAEHVELPAALALRIATSCEGNVRRAVLCLESLCMKYATPILPLDAVIDAPDWESFVKDIAGSICAKQSPDVLLQVRGHLYELLTNCIPPELIFRRLVIELLKKIDDSLKADVLHWAAFYEHRSHLGSKPIFHMEAFVARFMALYKQFMVSMLM